MHDMETYWMGKEHQDKVDLADSSSQIHSGSTQDKMLQKTSRSGPTLRQLVDRGRVRNFGGHLVIRRPQHAEHRTFPAPKFMPRARVLRGPWSRGAPWRSGPSAWWPSTWGRAPCCPSTHGASGWRCALKQGVGPRQGERGGGWTNRVNFGVDSSVNCRLKQFGGSQRGGGMAVVVLCALSQCWGCGWWDYVQCVGLCKK